MDYFRQEYVYVFFLPNRVLAVQARTLTQVHQLIKDATPQHQKHIKKYEADLILDDEAELRKRYPNAFLLKW